MTKPKHHILVCGSFRASGTSQGVCEKQGAMQFLPYLEGELADRGMHDVAVSATTCLKVCDRGPAMVIYPENFWYGNVTSEEIIDAILDALENGEAVEEHLIC